MKVGVYILYSYKVTVQTSLQENAKFCHATKGYAILKFILGDFNLDFSTNKKTKSSEKRETDTKTKCRNKLIPLLKYA